MSYDNIIKKQPPPPLRLNVNLDQTVPINCKCGCPFFHQALTLRRVSPLVSKSGTEEVIGSQVLICVNCNQPVGGMRNVQPDANAEPNAGSPEGTEELPKQP